MEDIARKLFTAFRKTPTLDIRVFVIGENHILRIIGGRYSWSEYSGELGYANITELDRGKVLAAFSKLEFLVNECLALYILSASSYKYSHQIYLVQKLPFRQRIESLKEFNLINASVEKKIKNLAVTRNFLAHEWDAMSATFDKRYLSEREVLEKFSRHLKSAFKILIDEYKRLQNETDYEGYLIKIIELLESGSEIIKP